MLASLLKFVRQSESKLAEGQRLPMSTEILEASFGLFKQLECQHSKGGFKTQREAEDARIAASHSLATGVYVKAERISLSDFLVDEWLPSLRPPVLVLPVPPFRPVSPVALAVAPRVGIAGAVPHHRPAV